MSLTASITQCSSGGDQGPLPPFMVSTLAGGSSSGNNDGTGTAAQFNGPSNVAVDSSGNVYVADQSNYRIRKISSAGVVTTFAGSSVGSNDGTGTAAKFNSPTGVAVDSSGNIYVADQSNYRIRKISSAGVVTTFAGSSVGSNDGTGTAAKFDFPRGVAVDSSGYVYVADTNNHRIRKISPAMEVTTFAGSSSGDDDGTGNAAKFNNPNDVAVDSSGYVYVADTSNHRIRKISPASVVSTFAGSSSGDDDGTGNAAKFNNPNGVAVDSSGYVYVADTRNHRIRKIDPAGVVSTFAGSSSGDDDGALADAQFNNPRGVAVDSSGNVYVADTNNNRIRKISR